MSDDVFEGQLRDWCIREKVECHCKFGQWKMVWVVSPTEKFDFGLAGRIAAEERRLSQLGAKVSVMQVPPDMALRMVDKDARCVWYPTQRGTSD